MNIHWENIDTVLLDMDGTLLDLHYDNYFWSTHLPQRYADIHNVPLEESEQFLNNHIRELEGSLNWYCLDYWSDKLSVDMGKLKSESTVKQKIQKRPYVEAFLQFLHSQDKNVVLATNAHPIGLEIKLSSTNIAQYFDHVITSHQFQQPKENQDFWSCLNKHLQTFFNFDPARCLFIDDNITVLKAAQTYGIAYTLGIHQPDSQKHRQLENIEAIHHFDEIIP